MRKQSEPTATPQDSPFPWHAHSAHSIFEKLDASGGGLTNAEAESRLKQTGPNRLVATKTRHPVFRFFLHFHNILIYVLVGSALITAFLQHWVDTGVIVAVIVINAMIGFIQEGKAEKAMDAIRHMLPARAAVQRDGTRLTIEAEYLVPGDIVLLEAGDKVPADIRLVQAHGMTLQEAILTGESVPVEKQIVEVAMDAALGDRKNMVYSGTLVSTGQGRGIVVATGSQTEIGRISNLLSTVELLTTPLVAQMSAFARTLTIVIMIIAVFLFGYGQIFTQYNFTELFMAIVGLSVAAIPEGLPAVLTITLAIGVQKMARRNVIVRRLPAIETIGSVSVICTDKTGTLTRNEMMVVSVLTSRHLLTLEGSGYEPKGMLKLQDVETSSAEHEVLEELARASILCSDAVLKEHDGQWTVEGDPMEGALLSMSGKLGIFSRQLLQNWNRIHAIPFDSRHRYMATLNHDQSGQTVVYLKGAPEQILEMCCDQASSAGEYEALNQAFWIENINHIAEAGQRVLAFAMRKMPSGQAELGPEDVKGKLTLLGMVGMIDPPRPDAIVAVADCLQAGIRVKMITGDHALTASAIGRQIGLKISDTVLTGAQIDTLDDQQLQHSVQTCDIFARTSPEHKLRLVMALQSLGFSVAMTGDGVNDAPALKRADAGIAMGRKGSEAAKEAAELILADDNFASIAAAVQEGRTVYDNIKKVISWTLPTNAGEALTIIVALLLELNLPISPIQILWVNLITSITLGLTLAFEPTEAGTMHNPPRRKAEALLGATLIWHIVLVSVLFLGGVYGTYWYAMEQGYSQSLARTMVVNTLVVMEIFHLFFIRNIYSTSLTFRALRGTRAVWTAVIVITLAQFAITYLPPLQAVFSTEAVAFMDGLLIIGCGIILFIIIETEKQLRLRIRGI